MKKKKNDIKYSMHNVLFTLRRYQTLGFVSGEESAAAKRKRRPTTMPRVRSDRRGEGGGRAERDKGPPTNSSVTKPPTDDWQAGCAHAQEDFEGRREYRGRSRLPPAGRLRRRAGGERSTATARWKGMVDRRDDARRADRSPESAYCTGRIRRWF